MSRRVASRCCSTAAASSLVALNKTGIERNRLSTLLFTHFHGDHFGGLPAFLLEAQFVSRRTQPLTIAGPRGVEQRALQAIEIDFPGASGNAWRFPITYVEVTPETPATIAGVAVEAFPMEHDQRAGPCQGYRLQHGGKVFAFSGDSAWTDALIPLGWRRRAAHRVLHLGPGPGEPSRLWHAAGAPGRSRRETHRADPYEPADAGASGGTAGRARP